MREVIIYQYRERTIVFAMSQTTDGVWILWGPAHVVPDGSDAHGIGQRVLSALDDSRQGVPHPRDWKAVQSPLLTAAGVKTWAAFYKSAGCVMVEEDGGVVALIPTRRLGAKGGFEPELSRKVTTTREHPARIGELVAAAFQADSQ